MIKNLVSVITISLFATICNLSYGQTHARIVIKHGPTDGKFTYLNSYFGNGRPDSPSLIAAAWTYGGEFGTGRSFFNFDLPVLPENIINFKAELNLFYDPTSTHVGHDGDNKSKIERIITQWDENTMNWDNQPATDSTAVYLMASQTSNQNYPGIDVTDLVNDMYSDIQNSFGFRISLETEELYRSMIFASCNNADSSLWPTLVLEFDSCSLPANTFKFNISGLDCQFNYSDSTTTEWHWNFGDGSSSELRSPAHSYQTEGTYIVRLTAINSCGRTTMQDTIILCRKPVSDFRYRINGQIVNFTSLTENVDNWYWSFGNGFFSNLENPVYAYLEQGDYRVCLMVSNSCGSDISCQRLSIEDQTINQTSNKIAEIEISPNPTSKVVGINLIDGQLIYSLSVCTFSGQMIKKLENINLNTYPLDLSDVKSGTYIVKVITSMGEYTQLIIKL